jgi:hypothetical protein
LINLVETREMGQNSLSLGGSTTMSNAPSNMICGPETLKMLYEAYADVVRLTLAERTAINGSEDLTVRRQIGEILLTLHSEGENNPIALRQRALERFGSRQGRS